MSIRLCSCGFACDDDAWFQGHLYEHPRHKERAGLWYRLLKLNAPASACGSRAVTAADVTA